jgi:hypothetical protein
VAEPTIVAAQEPLAAAKAVDRWMLSRWKAEHFLRLRRARGT